MLFHALSSTLMPLIRPHSLSFTVMCSHALSSTAMLSRVLSSTLTLSCSPTHSHTLPYATINSHTTLMLSRAFSCTHMPSQVLSSTLMLYHHSHPFSLTLNGFNRGQRSLAPRCLGQVYSPRHFSYPGSRRTSLVRSRA